MGEGRAGTGHSGPQPTVRDPRDILWEECDPLQGLWMNLGRRAPNKSGCMLRAATSGHGLMLAPPPFPSITFPLPWEPSPELSAPLPSNPSPRRF